MPEQAQPQVGRRIRVLLAEDHIVVRQGLTLLLGAEPDIEVIALVASDGMLALELARRTQPDVVLMDVNMAGMDGIEATRRITAELPRVRVVGLSMDAHHAKAMMQAGAAEFLTKDCLADELLAAIRRCAGAKPSPAGQAGKATSR